MSTNQRYEAVMNEHKWNECDRCGLPMSEKQMERLSQLDGETGIAWICEDCEAVPGAIDRYLTIHGPDGDVLYTDFLPEVWEEVMQS
jgi:hypothetical protein